MRAYANVRVETFANVGPTHFAFIKKACGDLAALEKAQQKAIDQGDSMPAAKIGGFQFRDIRPKAASEIADIGDASLLLGHSKQEITKRVYRRIGAAAKPSK